jgi:branched-chain amino acid aminotransferase
MAATSKYIWMDGQFVAWADAKIHVLSEAITRGISVFEGIRAYWGPETEELYVFRFAEHMRRLEQSMKVLRLSLPYDVATITDATIELIRRCGHREDTYIRPCVYVGEGEAHSADPSAVFMGSFVTTVARPAGKILETGIKVGVSSWRRNDDQAMPPRVKASANYLNSRLAQTQAKADGYDSAILLTEGGKVSETPGACVMLLRDGEVVTPDVSSNILESVTRKTLCELIRNEIGLQVVERTVDRSELYLADEIWMCGTGQEVVPITAVDRMDVGNGQPGALTRKVQKLYFDVARGRVARYSSWLHPVYASKRENVRLAAG